jgi:hypothetical protein
MAEQLDMFAALTRLAKARKKDPEPAPPGPPEPEPVREMRNGDPLGPAQEPAEQYLQRGLDARQPCVFLWGGGGLVQVRFHDKGDGRTTSGTGWLFRKVAVDMLDAAGYRHHATLKQRREADRWEYTANVYRPA